MEVDGGVAAGKAKAKACGKAECRMGTSQSATGAGLSHFGESPPPAGASSAGSHSAMGSLVMPP